MNYEQEQQLIRVEQKLDKILSCFERVTRVLAYGFEVIDRHPDTTYEDRQILWKVKDILEGKE